MYEDDPLDSVLDGMMFAIMVALLVLILAIMTAMLVSTMTTGEALLHGQRLYPIEHTVGERGWDW